MTSIALARLHFPRIFVAIACALLLPVGCSATSDKEDQPPVEQSAPENQSSFGGPLLDDVETNASLFAADTHIVVVARSNPGEAPTWLDALVGIGPAEALRQADDDSQSALTGLRDELRQLFHRRIGFIPAAGSSSIVLAAGPKTGTLVITGTLDYVKEPKRVVEGGQTLLQIDVPDMPFGQLWAVELTDPERTAVFFSREHALPAVSSEKTDNLANYQARLETFGRLLGESDGYLGIAALTGSGGLKDLVEDVLFDLISVNEDAPAEFALVVGEALEFRFFDSRARIGNIERDIRQSLDRAQARSGRMLREQLDQLPLATVPIMSTQIALMHEKIAAVDTILTTESVTYRVPIDPVSSRRAIMGIVALHLPHLASMDYPEPSDVTASSGGDQ